MTPTIAGPRLVQKLQGQIAHTTYLDEAIYYPPQKSEAVLDTYGHYTTPTESTATGGTVCKCSFNDTPNIDSWKIGATGNKISQIETSAIEGEIRVASITPALAGRFMITKRFGIDVVEVLYEVIGLRERGEFGSLCALKKAIV